MIIPYYASDFKLERGISRLENDMQKTLVWFESNMMVVNLSRFQFMFMGLGHDYKLFIEIDGMVNTVKQVKFLGIIIGTHIPEAYQLSSRQTAEHRLDDTWLVSSHISNR